MRQPQHDEVRAAFGLPPKAKLPIAGLDPISFMGWVVWAEPLCGGKYNGRKFHRALASCPKCNKIVSAGRMAQHWKSHKED